MQMKAVESRSERAAQQRTPLEDIQNNDEILPLEINDDMDDFLNDNNDDFLNENEDLGGSLILKFSPVVPWNQLT